jgi:alpha-methylacyl-CoA racemase
MSGPLQGIRVVEMAAIGPVPFACMVLSDLGAEVIRVDRISGGMSLGADPADILNRGRKSIAVDLKHPDGVETTLQLIETADILVEGFRPGVMEKLGLGPDVCLKRHPRLVYGRGTGWGQDGPLSQAAGHDINYMAITGALDAIGRRDSGPVPPINLGDFAAGSMFLVAGVLSALLEARSSGKGQVVDAAIVDGLLCLLNPLLRLRAFGQWDGPRQSNLLDGGAPFYDTYECADGKWVAVGSIEPEFYALLAEKLGVDLGAAGYATHFDRSKWPPYKARVAAAFKTKSRDKWREIMEGTDVCFAPVLSFEEAPQHPHNVARGTLVVRGGVLQSMPAPRFSRTPGEIGGLPVAPGCHTEAILLALGLDAKAIESLKAGGAVR